MKYALLTCLLALAGLQCITETPTSDQQSPNIIFILADDLGYGDLGSYGQQEIATPNLDRMAAGGMQFTRYYSGSTVCAPSRCVLMTGLHTGNCRIRGNGTIPLQDDDVTVAEKLKEAGYTTGVIGKWGLGEAGSEGVPNKQGFDYFFGYLNQIRAHNYYPDYLWKNDEEYPLDNEIEIVQETYAKGVGSYATKKVQYAHDLFAEEALQFVDQHQDEPFFLYLALTIPHANNESHLNGEHGMEVPDYGQYVDRDWPEVEKGAAAMITRMDRDIGRLMDILEEKGIANNTIIFFTSDNGPHAEGDHDPDFFNSNGPLRGIKRDLYEGGIRVPMIAYWPGTIAAGGVSDHLSAFWDFMPTAMEIAGVEGVKTDGISMLPALTGAPQPSHKYLYWEFHERGKKQAIIRGDYKLVRLIGANRIELYNLTEDEGESNNIADEQPSMVEALMALMQTARSESPDWVLE